MYVCMYGPICKNEHIVCSQGLESELRRLQEATLQGMEGFDEKLKRLFYLKIKSEIAVNQEELKILRLGAAILLEEEMLLKESQLNKRLEDKKNAKASLLATAPRNLIHTYVMYAHTVCLVCRLLWQAS